MTRSASSAGTSAASSSVAISSTAMTADKSKATEPAAGSCSYSLDGSWGRRGNERSGVACCSCLQWRPRQKRQLLLLAVAAGTAGRPEQRQPAAPACNGGRGRRVARPPRPLRPLPRARSSQCRRRATNLYYHCVWHPYEHDRVKPLPPSQLVKVEGLPGVGKAFLIMCLCNISRRTKSSNKADLTSAPTGSASFLISGRTHYNFLGIPTAKRYSKPLSKILI